MKQLLLIFTILVSGLVSNAQDPSPSQTEPAAAPTLLAKWLLHEDGMNRLTMTITENGIIFANNCALFVEEIKAEVNIRAEISATEIKLLESKSKKVKGDFGGKCRVEIKKDTSQYQLSADGSSLRLFSVSKNGEILTDNTYKKATW